MGITLTINDVREIEAGIWDIKMSPYEVRHLGNCDKSIGSKSVLLFDVCKFNKKEKTISFTLNDVTTLNIGTTASVIGIAAARENSKEAPQDIESGFSRGDREFLALAKSELPDDMYEVSLALLRGVRSRSAGELKKGKSRNFSEQPDNFWYVIVQPRISELSVTVRGDVNHFAEVADLEIKDDRGNTRFKVREMADVPKAVDLIFHAVRK